MLYNNPVQHIFVQPAQPSGSTLVLWTENGGILHRSQEEEFEELIIVEFLTMKL